MDDNLIDRIADKVDDQLFIDKSSAKEKYRSSGFRLMTTIITLCSGAIAGIFAKPDLIESPKCAVILLSVPIGSSLLQQLFIYSAEVANAHARSKLIDQHLTEAIRDENLASDDDVKAAKSKYRITDSYKDTLYGIGDFFCFISFLSFLFVIAKVLCLLKKT